MGERLPQQHINTEFLYTSSSGINNHIAITVKCNFASQIQSCLQVTELPRSVDSMILIGQQ